MRRLLTELEFQREQGSHATLSSSGSKMWEALSTLSKILPETRRISNNVSKIKLHEENVFCTLLN